MPRVTKHITDNLLVTSCNPPNKFVRARNQNDMSGRTSAEDSSDADEFRVMVVGLEYMQHGQRLPSELSVFQFFKDMEDRRLLRLSLLTCQPISQLTLNTECFRADPVPRFKFCLCQMCLENVFARAKTRHVQMRCEKDRLLRRYKDAVMTLEQSCTWVEHNLQEIFAVLYSCPYNMDLLGRICEAIIFHGLEDTVREFPASTPRFHHKIWEVTYPIIWARAFGTVYDTISDDQYEMFDHAVRLIRMSPPHSMAPFSGGAAE